MMMMISVLLKADIKAKNAIMIMISVLLKSDIKVHNGRIGA
jgi:hypothetical protein